MLFFNNKVYSQVIGTASCSIAASLTINDPACGAGTTANVVSVSAGSNPTICGKTVKNDKWFRFQTLNTTATTTIIAIMGHANGTTNRDLAIEVLTACSAASIACADVSVAATTESLTLNLAANTVYFLRIANVGTAAPLAMNYNVCVTQPPENDEPVGATLLTVENGFCASPITLSNLTAKASTCAPLPSCGNYSGTAVDVWCKLVVPPSGNFFLQTYAFGLLDNAALAVYSSSVCGAGTLLGCSDGNPNGIIDPLTSLPYDYSPMSLPTLNITGATPNSTVYVRVWNEDGYPTGEIQICANDMGPCGNPSDNDFCSNPISLNTAGATFTSVATNTVTGIAYTYDDGGDLSVAANNVGCIYPGNNSWYSFVATSADELGLTIPFTLNGSVCDIEAAIYSITRTASGCCENFEQLSDCAGISGGSNTFTVSVPPGALVQGNTYNIMINNSDPAACSFSITGWSITGVLPVEFSSFKANNIGKHNLLEWMTASEQNMKSYELEHSEDAVNFSLVNSVKAKGSLNSNTKYQALDENPFSDLNYYRIKQIENSGAFKYSNVISINLKNLYDNIYNIHPNPTTNNVNFEYYSKGNTNIEIELLSYAGNIVFKQTQKLEEGKNNITLPLSELDNGVYILKVVSEKSGKTTHHKIIKN